MENIKIEPSLTRNVIDATYTEYSSSYKMTINHRFGTSQKQFIDLCLYMKNEHDIILTKNDEFAKKVYATIPLSIEPAFALECIVSYYNKNGR